MKSRIWMWMIAVYLFAALAMPVWTAAQDSPSQDHKPKHHQYKLIDLGTFGGPNSSVPSCCLVSINSQGTVIVQADTPTFRQEVLHNKCQSGRPESRLLR